MDASMLSKKPDFKIEDFKNLVEAIKSASKDEKLDCINALLKYKPLYNHYSIKEYEVLAECEVLEYPHELHTSKKLLKEGYHVVFVPKGYFKRNDKKFDIFLIKGYLLFEADLKCINTCNPDTIAKRIKEGSTQASRIILDIHSNISKNTLIDGLRSGFERNENLIEIMTFYNSSFYRLQKTQVLSKNIYHAIK